MKPWMEACLKIPARFVYNRRFITYLNEAMEHMEQKAESIFSEEPAKLIKEHRGYYLLVNAIAKRVRGLQLGDKALALPPDGSREVTRIAIQEFLDGKTEIARTVRRVGDFGEEEYEEEGE